MKRIALLAALVAMPCVPALTHAQADKPAAKPAAAAEPAAKRGRDTRDARACLQLATNREIMVCAEKYR